MATLLSYDLNGKKLSFANWISNLSPEETPFTSMTKKESIDQTLFQWQNDSLSAAGENAVTETSAAVESNMSSTTVRNNVTQILRKTVKISDTTNALANYGRGRELEYQMTKAGAEIKRDLEFAFLNNKEAVDTEVAGEGRVTAGFHGLVAPLGAIDQSTGAEVHKESASAATFTEAEIFDLTYNLYMSGSEANTIMFHPKWVNVFSNMQEKAGARKRLFENTPKVSVCVSVIKDPLGQEFELVPNRWMPEDSIYFFNPSDFTQMVLRSPSRTKLSKDGSYEKWMIEMEVGLRLKNPFAAGVLDLKGAHGTTTTGGSAMFTGRKGSKIVSSSPGLSFGPGGANDAPFGTAQFIDGAELVVKEGTALRFSAKGNGLVLIDIPVEAGKIRVIKDGKVIWTNTEEFKASSTDGSDWTDAKMNTNTQTINSKVIIPSVKTSDAGIYSLHVVSKNHEEYHGAISLSVERDGVITNPLAS